MIKAKKNKIFNNIFKFYLKRILKKHFYRIHITGTENLKLPADNLPTIFYANHVNWWDGFIAHFISNIAFDMDSYIMMDIEQMKKYTMFRYIGVFSVDRINSREAINSINYASGLLKGTASCLWMFPEGDMHVQDHEPVHFYSGITRIASGTGKVNLQPAAFRFDFIGEQRPEIFISIGRGDIIESNSVTKKDLTKFLADKLTAEVNQLKDKVIKKQFEGFNVIFRGKESRNKTIDRIKG